MIRLNKLSSSAALVAAFSMASSPALAADLPAPVVQSSVSKANVAQWDGDATTFERHRRWRHRNRVDAGDVIAGVLILGGIAAIASAASNKNERRSNPREDYRYRDDRDSSEYRRSNSGEGLDRAVDMCLAEIERDVRVDEVSNVARDRDGWIVSGRLYNDDGFYCRIDNQGRIADISYSGKQASYDDASEDRQWSDEDYAQARLRTGSVPYQGGDYSDSEAGSDRPDYDSDDRPAYPGGPIDGDLEEDGYGG